ncbi:MAG TPA: DUF6576 domain-containing protein [Opitutales bacterium]|nr:DUF6576 domain-containing protein [Opitutales bacterium]
MRFYSDHRDNTPLRYFGRMPVYAATILAALYVAGLFVTVILNVVHGPREGLEFSTEQFFHHFWLWQIFTCTFINDPQFFFPFAVFFFYQFGSELEQFFGRRTFFKLYGALLLTIVLILGAWQLLGVQGRYYGMNEVTIGLFVAYATLYPNLECFGWVPMKYVAFACCFISAMGYLSGRDWYGLSILSGTCLAAFGLTRYLKLGGSVEFGEWAARLNPFRRRPKLRVLPNPERATPRAEAGTGTSASVDAILDKIARDGFASLSQGERDQLEKAREILNKKRN